METREEFRIGQLLIAGIASLPAEYWPFDVRAFAVAARNLTAEDNRVASKFRITEGPTGYHSYEFREILSLMHTATLISYDSQDNAHFYVRVSKRVVAHLHDRAETTPEEIEDVKALLLAHWKVSKGRDWKAEES